jgi:hypothetical protein
MRWGMRRVAQTPEGIGWREIGHQVRRISIRKPEWAGAGIGSPCAGTGMEIMPLPGENG